MQVPPEGIRAVNGSDVSNKGCTGPLRNISGVIVCSSGCSTLLDGISPTIDTSTSDWASQLVTVRITEYTENIPYPHVLLTFGFDTAVSLTGIELDMFICPEWNIRAPDINVFADEESNLVFHVRSGLSFEKSSPDQSSCDSLSTVNISLSRFAGSPYRTWHIVVNGFSEDIEWVHVGEVRFLDVDGDPTIETGIIKYVFFNYLILHSYTASACLLPTTTSTVPFQTCADLTSCLTVPPSTSQSPTVNPSSKPGNSGIVAAVVVPIVFILCVTIAAIAIIIIVVKRRHIHVCPGSSSSDTDLSKWQHVVSEPGGEFQRREQHEEHSGNNLNASYPMAEPYHLQNQFYSSSNNAELGYMAEGLYDEVDRDDLLDDEYEDANSRPTPMVPPRGAAPNEAVAVAEVASGTHVYSHIHKKSTPSVPQKSNDLVKYLSGQEARNQAAPHLPNSKKQQKHSPKETAKTQLQPQSGHISKNPVYGGNGEAVEMSSETHAFLETATGHELYDQPRPSYSYEQELPSPEPPINESIYNEPITPSDFTFASDSNGQSMDENPHIYAPVYAIPTMMPEGFQKPMEMTNYNIIEKKELGVGQFGKVVLAATNDLSLKDMKMSDRDDNKNISIFVAVKRLSPNPSREEREMFEKEVKFMSSLKHQNVVSLIGVCYDDPAFIMMEYMEEGDLSQFLQRYTDIVPVTTFSSDTQITTSTLVYMASQIASAMQYLTSRNYIHRDLASRNCLVGGNFIVKLADFGMSRSLYQSHYYRIQGNAVLPIRWMATESFFGIFSEKSDVWAFGVTMWELFTLAKEDPYSHLTDTEVVEDAIKGVHRQLLSRPPTCPKSVYKIMERCWIIDPKGRASFKEVEELLQTYWYTPDATM